MTTIVAAHDVSMVYDHILSMSEPTKSGRERFGLTNLNSFSEKRTLFHYQTTEPCFIFGIAKLIPFSKNRTFGITDRMNNEPPE